MANASAIKAGEAYIRMFLDKDEVDRNLKVLQASLNRFARTAQQVGLALTAIGGSALFGLSRAVKAANDVELTSRRLDAVFGDAADGAREFARVLATEIGASRFDIEKSLTTFQSFAKGVGFTGDQAIKLAQDLTSLSRDFGAFQGIDSGESLQRFISALSGSPEVLDRFGINLKAAAIDAQFAAKGLDETTESASEFQKVLARYDIILKTLQEQGAIGKARQELDKFNGRLVQAKAAALDFLVAVGGPLLSALKPVLISFTLLVKSLTAVAEAFPILSIAIGGSAVAITLFGASLIALAVSARVISFTLNTLQKTAIATGISLQNPIKSIKNLVGLSKILRQSLLTTIAVNVLGSKKTIALGNAFSRLVPIFAAVSTAIKAVASPVLIVVGAIAALAGVLILLGRRLVQIFVPVDAILNNIGKAVQSVGNLFRGFANIAVASINRIIGIIPGLDTALQSISDILKPIIDDFKEGLKEVKELFTGITDFLGLTGKTKIEVALQQSGGLQLSPEEQLARDKEIALKRQELNERIEDLRIAGIRNTTRRALAEIETRYAREIAIAGNSEEEIAGLRRAKEQELANLRSELLGQFYRRLSTLDNQLARERAAGINNEFERRRREAEIARDIALKAEGSTIQERERINELFNARIENIERDRIDSVAEFEKTISQDILDVQADGVKTRLQIELDAIKRKYDAEREEAERLGADLESIDRARRAREDRAIRSEAERQKQAIDDINARRADANEELKRQIDDLDIDLSGGTDLEKQIAKLELRRNQLIADSDADPQLVNESIDKQIELARINSAGPTPEGLAFGTFSAKQIQAGLGAGGNTEKELLERQLKEQEKTNRELREIRKAQGARP